jgi:hypothetical protein
VPSGIWRGPNTGGNMTKSTMDGAKQARKDEFYTLLPDIEAELRHYKDQFKGKTVFCNCDDPMTSNFWRYFHCNFNHLGLKRIISTHYVERDLFKQGETYSLIYDGGNDSDYNVGKKVVLKENGDFRSQECINLLEQSDIVCTNPPFSLFREYVSLLENSKKKFLIIGNTNALSYKEIFKLFQQDKMRTGYTNFNVGMYFLVPDDWEDFHKVNEHGQKLVRVSTSCWYTNLYVSKHHERMTLYKKYDAKEYPRYDNFDAIEVGRAAEIPMDWPGIMGVPITFLDKYNPEQFEIIGEMVSTSVDQYNFGYPYVGGKKKYARLLIKNKELSQ